MRSATSPVLNLHTPARYFQVFFCFLLRLGYIKLVFKKARRILSGLSSFILCRFFMRVCFRCDLHFSGLS